MELDLGGIFVQNSTFNYDDYEYEEECKGETSGRFEALFIPVLYSLTLAVGLLGNGLLVVVLTLKRRKVSVTDIFFFHLGMADILLLGTLPFWAAAQGSQDLGWRVGTPLCKIIGSIFNINFYCGIFLLACISLDRYLSIIHASQMYSRRKCRLVHFSCLLVWLFSLLLSIPDLIFLEAVKYKSGKTECIPNYQSYWRLPSRLLYHTVGFLLPSVILLFCFSCILVRLQRDSQGLQKQRAIRVILALVAVFFLCWTPYNITLMVDTFRNKSKAPAESADTSCGKPRSSLEFSVMLTSALGCFHACLNPLVYIILCRNFRVRVLGMLKCVTEAPAGSSYSLWESGVREDPLPDQAQEKVVLQRILKEEQQVQSTQLMTGKNTNM
ncbi:C-X-C chemokine receptor type 3-like [Polymixia lowei]